MTHDESFPDRKIATLAFGSCHNNKKVMLSNGGNKSIWNSVSGFKPEAFIWTGDSVYAPEKGGVASISTLTEEYQKTLTNDTVGYGEFIKTVPLGAFGTWDDHDFGANDAGKELPDKDQRQDAFLNFLGRPQQQKRRDGVYSSVTIGTPPNQVLVIMLDTRTNRDRHCIPSIASLPLGNVGGTIAALISCMTRWLTVSFQLNKHISACWERHMLSSRQWQWLEEVIASSTAQAHVVVSSIQFLTTNPAPESWGHFDTERARLMNLFRELPGLVILSGDVHFAELSTTHPKWYSVASGKKRDSDNIIDIVEVTSSGLTHSVKDLGSLAEWQLKAFDAHRFGPIYLGRNFGTIHFDWNRNVLRVDVHDHNGGVVLSTGDRPIGRPSTLSEYDIIHVRKLHGGKLFYLVIGLIVVFGVLIVCTPPHKMFRQIKRKNSEEGKKEE
jgi:alkaline phosphatase D